MGDIIRFTFWKACSGFIMKENGTGKKWGRRNHLEATGVIWQEVKVASAEGVAVGTRRVGQRVRTD